MVHCDVAMGGVVLRAGLAAVNVVQTAYNAVEAITNVLMAANPVGFLVIAIAALAAGFVLAYNTLKPFHDALNTAFVLRVHACNVPNTRIYKLHEKGTPTIVDYDAAGNPTDLVPNGVLDTHHDFDVAN
jgi:hypothetical protein